MKEVEVKAILRDRDSIEAKLKALGCTFEEVVKQEDVVYALNVGSLEAFNTNDVFLRIRVKDGTKVLFTLKKRGINDLDAIEHETEIASKDEMREAILLMGYQEAVRISKSRVTTRYNDCEICLDIVEGLGSFIEVEKLVTEGDSEQIQKDLYAFLFSIGIEESDKVHHGYDVLTLQKTGK
jgi:adenylate cyclase class 2